MDDKVSDVTKDAAEMEGSSSPILHALAMAIRKDLGRTTSQKTYTKVQVTRKSKEESKARRKMAKASRKRNRRK